MASSWLIRAGAVGAAALLACQHTEVPLPQLSAPELPSDASVAARQSRVEPAPALSSPDAATDAPAPEASGQKPPAADESAPAADAGTPVRLPGMCVEPLRDAAKRSHREGCFLVSSLDLDADGRKDANVVCGAFDHHLLYVLRGECGHFVGDVRHDCWITKDPGVSHGLIDLDCEMACTCDGRPHDAVRFRYRFDGTVLRETRQVTRGGCNCWTVSND